MKKIFLISTLLVINTIVFTGCDDNDDLTRPNNQEVESMFSTMYPNASRIEWERKGEYWVVDFYKDTKEMEAWFKSNGEWYQTETDQVFTSLPPAVQRAFQSGEYKSWHVDDVDMFEQKDTDTFYVLDVEKGNQDYDLHYSTDGRLIKAVIDPS